MKMALHVETETKSLNIKWLRRRSSIHNSAKTDCYKRRSSTYGKNSVHYQCVSSFSRTLNDSAEVIERDRFNDPSMKMTLLTFLLKHSKKMELHNANGTKSL